MAPSERPQNRVASRRPALEGGGYFYTRLHHQAVPSGTSGRNWTLIRGFALAILGTACSHVRWQVPPMTRRSPQPRSNAREVPPPAGRSRKRRGAPSETMATTVCRRLPADAVAVKRHAVAPVPVGGERDLAQGSAITGGERLGHLQHGGMPGPVVRQRGHEARDVDHALVHLAPLGAPPRRGPQGLEERLVSLHPGRQMFDPGPAPERDPPQS